jgi:DNA primase
MVNIQKLLQSVDLIDLVASDLGQPVRKSGKYAFFRCPFHADKTPSFAVTKDRYYCFGCHASGDGIKWIMERQGLSFLDACTALSTDSSISYRPIKKITEQEHIAQKRPDAYQPAWREIIDVCQKQLWTGQGARALEYLHKRGLTDQILKSPFFRVGFSTGQTIAGVWVDHGIVIPCFRVDQNCDIEYIDYIKIRHNSHTMPKYRKLTGGGKGLYGASSLLGADIIFVVEGEFDCLLLTQEAGDLVGVCTLGGATDRFDWGRFGKYISYAKWLFIAYDGDIAGEKGVEVWQALSGRVKRACLPEHAGKDITDAWKSGVNLSDWVMDILTQNKLI